MKPINPIRIKEGSEFWKSMQDAANQDAEAAAASAAERARKEVLEKAEKRASETKAYLDSIRHYDKLEFKNQDIRQKIENCVARRAEIAKLASDAWIQQDEFHKELKAKCTHDMCIEIRTTYRDEYDNYHDGHYERKCIECFLVESSDYAYSSRSYRNGRETYKKLEKSQVVLLRKTVDGKEYELEFDDLKW